MKHFILIPFIFASSLFAADSITTWFEEGSVKGNVKYYFIETKKDKSDGSSPSSHANSLGGTLSYTTGNLYGFSTGATFMTTNGFALPSSVDTSILGRDNGVREEGSISGEIAQDSFSVLGEVFLKYQYEDFTALYGRTVIKTPLIHAKEVRMLPSAVQGAFVDYQLNETNLGASYLSHFKQRTSSKFVNIIEHALGDKTQEITGSTSGEVIILDAVYKNEKLELKAYNYYADNFLNSLYLDASFKNKINTNWSYNAAVQYINQTSIGNADDYFKKSSSVTGGKEIEVNALSAKIGFGYKEANFVFALSEVLKDNSKHDSLVLPWDGTPLLTNMITSNDLFQSNYGKSLTADSIYIGGSRGVKLGYTQKYDFTGVEGFKTMVSYLNIDNEKFKNNQEDFNAVISYTINSFSLALKGIWVNDNTSQKEDGSINQDDSLTQYRVIANYKF